MRAHSAFKLSFMGKFLLNSQPITKKSHVDLDSKCKSDWKAFGLYTSSAGLKLSSNFSLRTLNNSLLHEYVSAKEQECTSVTQRRKVGFLQILAHRSPLLSRTLLNHPYNMPLTLLTNLKNNSDVQSLVRRMGSRFVHFEDKVAMEILLLARQMIEWIRGKLDLS